MKQRHRWLLLPVIILSIHSVSFPAARSLGPFHDELIRVISQFARPCTFLEIGGSEHVLALATQPYVHSIAMIRESSANSLIARCQQQQNRRITVLQPSIIDGHLLEKFGQCEHIDVVYVHADTVPTICIEELVDVLMNLGDYVLIEAGISDFERGLGGAFALIAREGEKVLCLSHAPKTKIMYARMSQKKPLAKDYTIISTLQEKLFKKPSLEKPIPWVHGINLVTFSMLQGVYPTDDIIRDEIRALHERFPDHNDFVIGNMIVQGDRLMLIDVDDSRRFAKSSRCARLALKAFKKGNERLENPKKWMSDYYRKLSKD